MLRQGLKLMLLLSFSLMLMRCRSIVVVSFDVVWALLFQTTSGTCSPSLARPWIHCMQVLFLAGASRVQGTRHATARHLTGIGYRAGPDTPRRST